MWDKSSLIYLKVYVSCKTFDSFQFCKSYSIPNSHKFSNQPPYNFDWEQYIHKIDDRISKFKVKTLV